MDNSITSQIENLLKLKQLYEAGILTREEVETEKQKILGTIKIIQSESEEEESICKELEEEIERTNKEWEVILSDQAKLTDNTDSQKNIKNESTHILPQKHNALKSISCLKEHILPIKIAAVFVIGWLLFDSNYTYTDYWIDEWVVSCGIFGLLFLVLLGYYGFIHLRKKHIRL